MLLIIIINVVSIPFIFFFFFTFTFKTMCGNKLNAADASRIYKGKYDLSIIRLRGIPACSSLSTHFFELTEFTIDSFVLDDEMRHAEDDRFFFFLFSFSLFSLSLSLPLIYTHTYTSPLSNSPFFLSSIQMRPQGDVIARANMYVEIELFTVRMQGKRLGVSPFPKTSRGKIHAKQPQLQTKNQGFGGGGNGGKEWRIEKRAMAVIRE